MKCKCGNRLALTQVYTGERVKTAIGICEECCTRHTLLTVIVSSTKVPWQRGEGSFAAMKYYDKVMESDPSTIPIGKKTRKYKMGE